MWATLLSWGAGLFSDLKNIIIGVLCLCLLVAGGYAWFRGGQVEARDKTITAQDSELKAKNAEIQANKVAIEEYKQNIELAKQHQAWIVVVEKRAAKVRQTIQKIKVTRELTNEEIVPADSITDMFNSGLQQQGSAAGAGGEVLSESGKANLATVKNGA